MSPLAARTDCARRGSWVLALAAALLVGGCGGNGSASSEGGALSSGKFAACAGSPAVPYAPGMSVASASGGYRAALDMASTELASGSSVATAAIGSDAFTVSVTSAGDAGADAGIPDELTMTSTAIPWMPVHMHGASTLPAVGAQGDGSFRVSGIGFFMGGYWQLPLNLIPASGATDPVVFSICIPDD
jgi:hypothetical protein